MLSTPAIRIQPRQPSIEAWYGRIAHKGAIFNHPDFRFLIGNYRIYYCIRGPRYLQCTCVTDWSFSNNVVDLCSFSNKEELHGSRGSPGLFRSTRSQHQKDFADHHLLYWNIRVALTFALSTHAVRIRRTKQLHKNDDRSSAEHRDTFTVVAKYPEACGARCLCSEG